MSEEFLNIDTPENVAFNYEVAGVATRGLAAMVDSLLIALLQVMLFALIFGVTLGLDALVEDSAIDFMSSWALALLGLISFVFLWGYYVFFEMLWNGQSPGKRLLKLRVVRVDGMPIAFSESLIRNVVRLVDFLPAFYGFGFVFLFFHPRTRRLGDLAAGTLVVRDQGAVTLDKVAEVSRPAPSGTTPPVVEILPLERLTAQDIRMLETCLERFDTMDHSYETGLTVLRALFTRMDVPETWMEHSSVRARLRLILEGVQNRER